MISTVLFDLDDTLFPQSSWLDGAWRAVARRGSDLGASEAELHVALVTVAAQGSDGGRIVDRALERIGRRDLAVTELVEAFRAHTPTDLQPYPGVREAIAAVRRRVPIGLVTDGDPAIQRAKLDALGLERAFDVVVISDELGREHRKPDALPFQVALGELGIAADDAVFVGDRPAKDVAGARAAGLRAVRVRTGEWSEEADESSPWRTERDAVAACRTVIALLEQAPLSRV